MNPASLCLKCFAEVWHILRAHKSFLSSIKIHIYIQISSSKKKLSQIRALTTHNYLIQPHYLISTTKTNENSGRSKFSLIHAISNLPSFFHPKNLPKRKRNVKTRVRKIGEGEKFVELGVKPRWINVQTRVDFRWRIVAIGLVNIANSLHTEPLFAKPNFTLQCKFHPLQQRGYSRGNRGSTIPPSSPPFPLSRFHACRPVSNRCKNRWKFWRASHESTVNWFLDLADSVFSRPGEKNNRAHLGGVRGETGWILRSGLSDAFHAIIRPSEFVKQCCFDWLNFIRYWIPARVLFDNKLFLRYITKYTIQILLEK